MGKKVKGRKRHLVVDVEGLVLAVLVTSASLQDDQKPAAGALFMRLACCGFRRLRRIWADGMYEGSAVMWAKQFFGWVLEIVKRPEGVKGFQLLPRRWVIERTFAWFNRYRRLSKDYERQTQSSESIIYLAMSHLMLKRIQPA
jgi:putative transposase